MNKRGPEGALLFGIQATRLSDAAGDLFHRLGEQWWERPTHALGEGFSDPLLDPAQGHRGQQRLGPAPVHHKLSPHVQGTPQALFLDRRSRDIKQRRRTFDNHRQG